MIRRPKPLKIRIIMASVLVFLLVGAYGAIWCYTLLSPVSPSAEPDDAIKACNRSIYWHPKNGLFYWNRAKAYERMGDLETALADYDKAIELFSDPANNWAIRAVYSWYGHADEALNG
ncbi:MAG: tetratricopeptide repeat protein, partial [Candidatus Hydrogenedentes bacterium]|nr:tetratricopeptide repeat protein [Candidatus Hydrogenedentota bacterium]